MLPLPLPLPMAVAVLSKFRSWWYASFFLFTILILTRASLGVLSRAAARIE
jgi:hypothetical protein